MSAVIQSMVGEYRRYKAMAEGVMAQLSDEQMHRPPPGAGNSVTTVAWHVAGNYRSRFTDFLTDDGEKPWRDRESEFEARRPTRGELMECWEAGWKILFDAIEPLADADLDRTIRIRGTEHTVVEALHRSLAHASYHVGQMVYAGKSIRGDAWNYLTIPPGQSEAYNRNPGGEKPDQHADRMRGRF